MKERRESFAPPAPFLPSCLPSVRPSVRPSPAAATALGPRRSRTRRTRSTKSSYSRSTQRRPPAPRASTVASSALDRDSPEGRRRSLARAPKKKRSLEARPRAPQAPDDDAAHRGATLANADASNADASALREQTTSVLNLPGDMPGARKLQNAPRSADLPNLADLFNDHR